MKDFIQNLYNYDYAAEKDDVPDHEDNDEIHTSVYLATPEPPLSHS